MASPCRDLCACCSPPGPGCSGAAARAGHAAALRLGTACLAALLPPSPDLRWESLTQLRAWMGWLFYTPLPAFFKGMDGRICILTRCIA